MSVPKAVLYYSPESVWSAVALLALEEKGYGDDEVDRKIVDLSKAENCSPSFLRINPKATVPTLVVPIQKTLTDDVESRYKAITTTKAIVEFLDKSRSATSRTNTTSSAPAPVLTPATIGFTATCNLVIDEILHSEDGDPNTLSYFNAFDDASLQVLSTRFYSSLVERSQALDRYLAEAESGQINVTEKIKLFWTEKKGRTQGLLEVLKHATTPASELTEVERTKREELFQNTKRAWEVGLKDVLLKLNKEMLGPYILGDQLSIADLHLAGWLTRICLLAGAVGQDDGNTAIGKVETRVGAQLAKDFQAADARRQSSAAGQQSKVAAFWDAMKERESWKKVYQGGIF